MSSPLNVLVIDDEADVCTFFRRLLTLKGYGVATAMNEREALQALAERSFSVAMVDLKLPDTDGLTLLQAIKARQPGCEVIIMTGYSTIKTAVTAIQLGAYEYVEKPFDDIEEVETLVARAAARGAAAASRERGREEWSEVAHGVGFQVGTSDVMHRLVSLAYKIAGKNINVLIQGKTGTGKEVLARFVHAASPRSGQAFIPVNCGALPENLLESELFGHERGAFTGASQTRRGIFELANQGTLFLDEIGDASPQIQVKLLRVLETGEFLRVGGEKPIKTDVRIIAATNVDLEEAVREKTFREDLYYRLNVVRLQIPPLRERGEDIPLLAAHFVRLLNPELHLSPEALRQLQDHPWPGNIRELSNVMRRAVVMCHGGTIVPDHLGSRFAGGGDDPHSAAPAAPASPEAFQAHYGKTEVLAAMADGELEALLRTLAGMEEEVRCALQARGMEAPAARPLRETELETIRRALEQNRWNISDTARILGIGRNTLYRKIRLFDLRQP